MAGTRHALLELACGAAPDSPSIRALVFQMVNRGEAELAETRF